MSHGCSDDIMPIDSTLMELVPAIVANTGAAAAERYLVFFAEVVRTRKTREAYRKGATEFLGSQHVAGARFLGEIQAAQVVAYVEEMRPRLSTHTVKQRLAALHGLFDWLLLGGIIDFNPTTGVDARRPSRQHDDRT